MKRILLLVSVFLLTINIAAAGPGDPLKGINGFTLDPANDPAPITITNMLLSSDTDAVYDPGEIQFHAALVESDAGITALAADSNADGAISDDERVITYVGTGDVDGDGVDDLFLYEPADPDTPAAKGKIDVMTKNGGVIGDVNDGLFPISIAASFMVSPHDSSSDAIVLSRDGNGDVQASGWQSVTIPGKSIEQDSYREGDDAEYEKKTWGQVSFDDLEMERGVKPGDTKIHDWFEAIQAGKADEGRKEVAVKLLGDQGEPQEAWQFFRVKDYDPPAPDASVRAVMKGGTSAQAAVGAMLENSDAGTALTTYPHYTVSKASERKGRNPQTGKEIKIPARDTGSKEFAAMLDYAVYLPVDDDGVVHAAKVRPIAGSQNRVMVQPQEPADSGAREGGKTVGAGQVTEILDLAGGGTDEKERGITINTAGTAGSDDESNTVRTVKVRKGTGVVFGTDAGASDDAARYEWRLDGELLATTDGLILTFTEDGVHDVSVTTTTDDGSTTSHTVSVKVSDLADPDDWAGPQRTGMFAVTEMDAGTAPNWWGGTNTVVPHWLFDGVQLAEEQYDPDTIPGAAKRLMADRMLIEIAPGGDVREVRHTGETRESREAREKRTTRETRDGRQMADREAREHRDTREMRDAREHRDTGEDRSTTVLSVVTGADGDLERVTPLNDAAAFDAQVKISTDAATVRGITNAAQPGPVAIAAYREGYVSVQGQGVVNRVKYGVLNAVGKLAMRLGLVDTGPDTAREFKNRREHDHIGNFD